MNDTITFSVKNVIDHFETKAIERKLIKEKLINQEAKITLSNNKNAPIPIKKVVIDSKGLPIKYPFRCAICNTTHNIEYERRYNTI